MQQQGAAVEAGQTPLQRVPGDVDADQIGQRVGHREARGHPGGIRDEPDQDRRTHDVEARDDQLQQERCAGVLEGVVGAQAEELDREWDQADGEAHQRPGDEAGVAGGGAVAEEDAGDRAGQGDEHRRRGHDHDQGEADGAGEFGHDAGSVARGGQARRVRQHRGGEGDGDQRVGEDPQQVGLVVGVQAGAVPGGGRGGGEALHDDQRELVGRDEADGPGGQSERLAESRAAEVEAGPDAEPDLPDVGDQYRRLHHDAQRRAGSEQPDLTRGERCRVVLLVAPDHEIEGQHQDGDDVVGDGSPHHGAELVAGVEHLAQEEERAVEEDLRQRQVRQRHHGRVLALQLLAAPRARRVDRRHDRRPRRHHHGDGRDDQHERRHDPVGVRLAAVRIVADGPDDLRDENRVEGAAGEEDVDRVRHRVGQLEHVDLARADAEDEREHRDADDAQHPRDHGPRGHQGARGHQLPRATDVAHRLPSLTPSPSRAGRHGSAGRFPRVPLHPKRG